MNYIIPLCASSFHTSIGVLILGLFASSRISVEGIVRDMEMGERWTGVLRFCLRF